MRRLTTVGMIGLAAAMLLWAVDVAGNLNVLGTLTAAVVDFTGATSTAPMKSGTSLPASCAVGQAFFKTDATAGQNIYLCTATNTWTQVQGGGGGGTFDWKPSSRYVVAVSEMMASYNQASPAYLGDIILSRMAGSNSLNNPNYSSTSSLYPGAARINTTSTANDRQAWSARIAGPVSDNAQSLYARTDLQWRMTVVFHYIASTDSTDSSMYLGMMGDTSENPPRGLAVRYISGTDSSLTFAYGQQNAWGATYATGVAPGTGMHTLVIRSDGTTANKIWMQLDGGTEVDVCPSGCTLTASTYESGGWSGVFYVSLSTSVASQKSLAVEYLSFWLDRGTER